MTRPALYRLTDTGHGIAAYTPPPTPPRRRHRRAVVNIRRADPLAWAWAVELAGGDLRRLVINDDGSVTVANNRQR